MGTRGCKYEVLSKEVDAGIEFGRTVRGNIRHSQEPEKCSEEDGPEERWIREDVI